MAVKRAGLVQAEPYSNGKQENRGARRLLPKVLHEGLPANSSEEAAHLVHDP